MVIINELVIKIIKVYQKLLSPDHSSFIAKKYPHGFCRYYPTCSEYGILAFRKYNLFKASLKTIYRLIRCNPFSKGGVDYP